jgi:hypothetical protein
MKINRNATNPDTHQTRCGAPWKVLDAVVPCGTLAAVMPDGHEYDDVVWLSDDGIATNLAGGTRPEYDLIPKATLIDIPTLRPEIVWVAMDRLGTWVGYNREPRRVLAGGVYIISEPPGGQSWNLDCLGIKPDPMGWENSLHRQIDGKWVRCSEMHRGVPVVSFPVEWS